MNITDHLHVGLPRVGWICPKCKRIYAPDTKECEPCNKDKKS